jgi:hypothetical protein
MLILYCDICSRGFWYSPMFADKEISLPSGWTISLPSEKKHRIMHLCEDCSDNQDEKHNITEK